MRMLLPSWVPSGLAALLRSPLGRLTLESLFELLMVIVFLKAYNMTRNLFGSQACTPQFALGHAQQIILMEQALGMFWEQEIQAMVLPYKLWIRAWNIFYGSAHMAVTVFVLVFLFILKPPAYQRCRTIFIIMNLFAIIGYAAYPLMPPRLVNDCEDKYGGCQKGYTFVDTMEEYGGLWSWRQKGVAKVTNHYAAMPSMHAGYSLWCSLSMYEHSPFMLFRVLAVAYPFLTLYCIVVTANHFFLDAVAGIIMYMLAVKLAPFMPKIGRGANEATSAPSQAGVSTGQQRLEDEPLLPITVADILKPESKSKVELGLSSLALGSSKRQ